MIEFKGFRLRWQFIITSINRRKKRCERFGSLDAIGNERDDSIESEASN